MSLCVQDVTVTIRRDFWSRKKNIVHDLSLSVIPKEVLGFLGPNGAGKTTTLKVMLGLIRPTLGGATIRGLSALIPRARERVGYLPERTYYPERLTAREFVYLHAKLTGLVGKAARFSAEQAIERVGLVGDAHRRLGSYSKGMLQRAGLAQALVGDPEILVLDEPMSGLDPVGRRDVRKLLLDLKEAEKTVVFSTHILPDVDALCDRVAVLEEGRLTKLKAADALVEEEEKPYEIVIARIAEGLRVEIETRVAQVRVRAHTLCLQVVGVGKANEIVSFLVAQNVRVLSMTTGAHQLEALFLGKAS